MARRACESPEFPGVLVCFALLACALVAAACSREKSESGQPQPHRPKLTALAASSWLIDLDVPGFGTSALAVPLGAKSARPIVIALHGSADRPEWACAALRSIAGPTPFVLCPRGVARRDFPANDPRYTFVDVTDTARELRAALAELKRRFAAYVAAGPVVFSGFESGADHVAWIAAQEPSFFSRLLLIEPAAASWSSSQAALFGRAGGQRVLFAFGPAQREELTLRSLLTTRGGADSRTVFLGDGPVTLEAPSRQLLRQHWAWLSAKAAPGARPPENLAGKALSAGGPVRIEPIDL